MASAKKFTIDYEKRKNTDLFTTFQSQELTHLSEVQNYIPIYDRFFSLNETNYNSINLNHKWYITDIKERLDENGNLFRCNLKNLENASAKSKKKDVFFKMAPLIDPFKILIGKHDISDLSLITLPSIKKDKTPNAKILEPNNSAYIDGFFSFLTSVLIHKHGFVHGVDYYGSFVAIKNDFKLNIIDDLDYLCRSDFFNKNKNVLFKVDEYEHILNDDDDDDNSRETKIKSRNPLKIEDISANHHTLSIKSIHDDMYENIFDIEPADIVLPTEELQLTDIMDTIKYNTRSQSISRSNSFDSGTSCSSRTSHTSFESLNNPCFNCEDIPDNMVFDLDNQQQQQEEEDTQKIQEGDKQEGDKQEGDKQEGDKQEKDKQEEEDEEEKDNDRDDWTDATSSNSDSEEGEDHRVHATLPRIPVQVICMESCDNTFDTLIMNDELSQEEWFSAFMQIIMILITYQKVFSFTHNDLHTNNVMYSSTDKKYMYYCFKNKYYKVPTFGRIFKIIDFGRGIYKFDSKIFCSDSFQTGEDASTQYNTEPYMNTKKPRLDPNYSFDLCRLACSIFDYMVDELDEIIDLSKCAPEVRLIVEWCLDDNGVNVLYKSNGEERYPDFKLYKMIARCVHNHVPQTQLLRPEFDAYQISKSTISGNEQIMNIDEIPILV